MAKRTLITIFVCIYSICIFCQTTDIIQSGERTDIDFSTIDSCIISSMGKDNATLILNADSIIAQTIIWDGCKEEKAKLSKEMTSIVKYTFCTPSMYTKNRKVYASFQPYSKFTFYHNGESKSIYLDYDINKWKMEENGKIVIYCDLKNSALLPLLYLLFPNNQLIRNCYKNMIK